MLFIPWPHPDDIVSILTLGYCDIAVTAASRIICEKFQKEQEQDAILSFNVYQVWMFDQQNIFVHFSLGNTLRLVHTKNQINLLTEKQSGICARVQYATQQLSLTDRGLSPKASEQPWWHHSWLGVAPTWGVNSWVFHTNSVLCCLSSDKCFFFLQ